MGQIIKKDFCCNIKFHLALECISIMNNDFSYGVSLHLYKPPFSQSSNNVHSSRMLMSCSSSKTANPLFNWILKVNEWQLSPGKVTKQTNLFSILSRVHSYLTNQKYLQSYAMKKQWKKICKLWFEHSAFKRQRKRGKKWEFWQEFCV